MSAAIDTGWDEAELHAWLAGRGAPPGARALIHDAAVLAGGLERPTLCCDRCEEGVHFDGSATPEEVGSKAAARALSDLAATAARPVGLLLSLAAPAGRSSAWMRACIAAVDDLGRRFGAPLVGGDLTAAGQGASLVVSALGEAPLDPPGRDRARPGELLALTGPVGGSRLGRHLAIEPRVDAAAALHAAGARALMDVSDGLALDLDRLARASSVVLELERVPLHADALRAARASRRPLLEHGLFDGEDHELIVCLTPGQLLLVGELGLGVVGRVAAADAERPTGLYLASDLCACGPGAGPRPAASQAPGEAESEPRSRATRRTWTAFDPRDPRAFVHGR